VTRAEFQALKVGDRLVACPRKARVEAPCVVFAVSMGGVALRFHPPTPTPTLQWVYRGVGLRQPTGEELLTLEWPAPPRQRARGEWTP
jgi:hypothetical protein